MSDSVIDWEELHKNPEYEVARVCTINTANLEHALENHAAIYAYANAAYAKARADKGRVEWQYEQAVARAFADLREEGKAIGEAKETAETDEAVRTLKKKVLEADREVRILYALVQGLEHRRDMLVQLAARERAELNNSY